MHTVTTTTSAIAYARTRARAHWSPIVNTGTTTCRRCNEPIRPGQPWDVGHPSNNPAAAGNINQDLAPEHRHCNRAGIIADQPQTFGW